MRAPSLKAVRRGTAPLLVACALPATQAMAAPCVGAQFDKPFPGAEAVETHVTDVPTPRFPGLWQNGRIAGYSYEIFANGDARLGAETSGAGWSILLRCDLGAGSCTQSDAGTPPALARDIARQIELCMVNPSAMSAEPAAPATTGQTTPERPAPSAPVAPATEGWALVQPDSENDPPPAEAPVQPSVPGAPAQPDPTLSPLPAPPQVPGDDPQPAAPEEDDTLSGPGVPLLQGEAPSAPSVETVTPQADAPEDTASPAAPCGLAALPEGGAPGLTLQRLLVAAGANPGPLDGIPGRRTRIALSQVLGPQAAYQPTAEAIAALDSYLCAQSD